MFELQNSGSWACTYVCMLEAPAERVCMYVSGSWACMYVCLGQPSMYVCMYVSNIHDHDACMYVCMYVWDLQACMYVCLRQLSMYVCMSQTYIHTNTWSTAHDPSGACMYVPKPRVLSSIMPLGLNGTHPMSRPLGDPQKVIHIDTILILVYIHTYIHTNFTLVALI